MLLGDAVLHDGVRMTVDAVEIIWVAILARVNARATHMCDRAAHVRVHPSQLHTGDMWV